MSRRGAPCPLPDAAGPAAWLLNGAALQLQATACQSRARPWHWRLLDRSDGRELARAYNRPPSPAQTGRQVPRPAWPELARWLAIRAQLRPETGPLAWVLPSPVLATALRARARRLCQALGLSAEDLSGYRLPVCDEPPLLRHAGHDLAGRDLWLTAATARSWRAMQHVAAADGITLLPVSGYRSIDYQAGLVARKQTRGLSPAAILRYSALPGHSEHHLGTVLDLHDGHGPALEESFEKSDAFGWLQQHAGRFGFGLSYGRDNPWGIGYEPWHWRYRPESRAGR